MKDAYDVHRGGAGTPLVLLHGINMSWRIWRPVIPGLELHHSVLAPTLAGHLGGPPLAAGPHGIAPLADAVEVLLDEAGIDRAHLVGNSLGGWLACELAQRGRALSVVALSPAGAWGTEKEMARLFRLMRLAGRAAGWSATRHLMSHPGLRRRAMRGALEHAERLPTSVALDMVEETKACLLLGGLLDWLTENQPLPGFDIDASCPVRLAWPYTDRTIPFVPYGEAFRALLPGSELVALRGVGHVPMYDDPGLVVRTVLEHTAPAWRG
jgi:pimeloyl-ACP methyl ester carboxylesterase